MSTLEDQTFKDFERLLSAPRFRRYRQATNSKEEAIALYFWNVALCEALYPSLQFFEIALRNATHNALSLRRGNNGINNPRWFMDFDFLTRSDQQTQVQTALRQVWSEKAHAIGDPVDSSYPKEPQRVVAALSLGFWINLYSAPYAQNIVQVIASDVFPNAPKEISRNRRQGVVYPPLKGILDLRNRVFHHEPIYHWAYETKRPEQSLISHYRRIHDVIFWMCEVQPAFLKQVDRFQAIYDDGPEQYSDSAQIGFWLVQEPLVG